MGVRGWSATEWAPEVLGLMDNGEMEGSNQRAYEAALAEMGMVHKMFRLDSSMFCLPQTRVRLFTVGLSPERLGVPLREVAAMLECAEQPLRAMQDTRHVDMLRLDNIILPRGHPDLVAFEETWATGWVL